MIRVVDLLDEHERFDEALERTRTDVHGRWLESGRARLAWLKQALGRHLELEEARLLPVFDALDHPVPNGAPAVLRRDHDLIRALLDRADAATDPVGLCAALGQLAGVLEHHDLREARYFKPRLDAVLDPEERAAWLAEHQGRMAALGPLPERVGVPRDPPVEPPQLAPVDRVQWGLATGQRELAEDALRSVPTHVPKSERLRQRVVDGLAADDLLAAWDASVLLRAVVTAGVSTA